MKLAEIPGGFALYKEKTTVGRCEVTATAQGAALTLLTIVPEWRRKGYGSYLLKEVLRRFGGYDKETATVFTAPLPGDEGERAFWEKFGFRAEGAQLCRRRKPFGPGYRRKLDEVQLVPQPGGILLQKRLRALQLLHDAGVLPPGKELHALVLQPAAQRPVRAADRNVKDHGSVSFAEKSS